MDAMEYVYRWVVLPLFVKHEEGENFVCFKPFTSAYFLRSLTNTNFVTNGYSGECFCANLCMCKSSYGSPDTEREGRGVCYSIANMWYKYWVNLFTPMEKALAPFERSSHTHPNHDRYFTQIEKKQQQIYFWCDKSEKKWVKSN